MTVQNQSELETFYQHTIKIGRGSGPTTEKTSFHLGLGVSGPLRHVKSDRAGNSNIRISGEHRRDRRKSSMGPNANGESRE